MSIADFFRSIFRDRKRDHEFCTICVTQNAEQVQKVIDDWGKPYVNALENPTEGHEKERRTALMCAASFNNDPKVIEVLVKAGANPNARTKEGLTVLMKTISRPNRAEQIKALVRLGANVNAKISSTERAGSRAIKVELSALTIAISTGYVENVEALLESGAYADMRLGRYKMTALMFAAMQDSPNIGKIILTLITKGGTRFDLVDTLGHNIWDYADKFGGEEAVKTLKAFRFMAR